MAEVVAGLYAVETVAEGAAAGALAVSGSTVPLHARFQKIKPPEHSRAFLGATATLIKNKVYLIGGKITNREDQQGVGVFSLAPGFGSSRTKGNEPVDVDYELTRPEHVTLGRPLQPKLEKLDQISGVSRDPTHYASFLRECHSSISIGDTIYVLGGVSTFGLDARQSNTDQLISLESILAFDTQRCSYSVIAADPAKCTEGLPEPRSSASCTSSPLPPPTSVGGGPSLDAYGTIFIHGGRNAAGLALHDTWTFDIGTQAWHKFPTILEESLQDKSVSGQIAYVDGILWYVNGSTVMKLELAEHNPQDDAAELQDLAFPNTGRVGSGQWQVVYPPPAGDPAALKKVDLPEDSGETSSAMPASHSAAPTDSTEHIAPITTGAGRNYLLSLGHSNPQSMHLFQIDSTSKTATSVKDTIRDKASQAISSLPESWKSGKYEWSKVEVIQSSMQDGQIERPGEEMEEFAVAAWEEYGDKLMIWGGQTMNGTTKEQGWIVHLD